MTDMQPYVPDLSDEFVFRFSRSSGPGGQNVNKVSTRVELRFNVSDSQLLTAEEKEIILKKLASRLSAGGILIVSSQEERSQLKNKELATSKLYGYLNRALKPVKKRKPTRPTHASVQKRLNFKKKQGEKKSLRNRVDDI
jgi:ribosome-associated protein